MNETKPIRRLQEALAAYLRLYSPTETQTRMQKTWINLLQTLCQEMEGYRFRETTRVVRLNRLEQEVSLLRKSLLQLQRQVLGLPPSQAQEVSVVSSPPATASATTASPSDVEVELTQARIQEFLRLLRHDTRFGPAEQSWLYPILETVSRSLSQGWMPAQVAEEIMLTCRSQALLRSVAAPATGSMGY